MTEKVLNNGKLLSKIVEFLIRKKLQKLVLRSFELKYAGQADVLAVLVRIPDVKSFGPRIEKVEVQRNGIIEVENFV